MTKEESENIRAQFLEAKQEAYLYGRAVERMAILKAAQDLLADGKIPTKTVLNSLLIVLKKKIRREEHETMA
jgi:hypothetical protein